MKTILIIISLVSGDFGSAALVNTPLAAEQSPKKKAKLKPNLDGPAVNVNPVLKKNNEFEKLAEKKPPEPTPKTIQPNSGQCAPGETSSGTRISDTGRVEDLNCTSSAPLGPDFSHQRGLEHHE